MSRHWEPVQGDDSRVVVAWFYVVAPMAAVLLMPEPAVFFLFGLPVGVVLGVYNSSRVCSWGVAHSLGALRDCSLPWSRVETMRIHPSWPGCNVTVYFDATHRELQGFARMRTTTTISILVHSLPREVLRSMDVRVPQGWVGPHVDELAEAAGDGFGYY